MNGSFSTAAAFPDAPSENSFWTSLSEPEHLSAAGQICTGSIPTQVSQQRLSAKVSLEI
jgi:hypothetical protein